MAAPAILDTRPTHLTTFTVKAGGVPLGADVSIVEVEVRREVNRIPRATIVLLDGNAADQTFAVSERESLVPGTDVEILGGYSSNETLLFRGVVTRHRVTVGAGGSRLTVELHDRAFRMTLGRRSRNFSDVTDSDVMEQVIGLNAGLTADVQATQLSHPQVVQHQASDWDFVVMRAEQAGYVVTCVDGTVKAAPPAFAGAAAAMVTFGEGLFSADLELDAVTQLAKVETAAWDMSGQELLTTEISDSTVAPAGNVRGSDLGGVADVTAALRHAGALDQSTLDQWANAVMGKSRRSAMRGRVRLQGTADLTPGTLIQLGGLGARFNGLAFVSGVRHRLGHGDWITEAVIGTDPMPHAERYRVAAPAAGGTIPPISGLQIAIVAALEGDPDGEDRIQVRLPTISETDGLLWARQAVLDAGDGRSTSFRPELEDEVIVGFIDGDPRHPVILGALHSSAKPNPIPGSDDNHEKAIVTRSGMRIHWNDDTVIATIDTPEGNKIVLSEDEGSIVIEDQNGNSITLSDEGIALDSARDLTLTASGDVKIKGMNVELSADTNFKASGSSGAEISSSATTTVKGSLVQIN